MFGLKWTLGEKKSIAFFLANNKYSIAVIKENKHVILAESRAFRDGLPELVADSLTNDVKRHQLIGSKCHIVMAPGQYQLLLMDALDVPEADMAKALRWKLKGLVDYPLNDILIDTFPIPPHGVAGKRKKIFVAVTPTSALKKRLAMFESAYLEVLSVGIAELALRNLMGRLPLKENGADIVISLEESYCQLHIFYKNDLYLVRELAIGKQIINNTQEVRDTMLLEIQRSMDYCSSELKLPEPKRIIFTPDFYKAGAFLDYLREELAREVILLNLNELLETNPPYDDNEQQALFYSMGGALAFEYDSQDEMMADETINQFS